MLISRKETVFHLLYVQKNVENRGIYFAQDEGEDKFVSFKELYETALKVGYWFYSNEILSGEELVISISEPEPFFYAFWGSILYGIIPVPISINPSNKSHLNSIFSILNKQNIIVDKKETFESLKANKLLFSKSAFENLVPNENIVLQIARKPADIAFVLFSSGSTSAPKGVGTNNRAVITSMYHIANRLQLKESSMIVSWLSINHSYAIAGAHLLAMYVGANQCYIPTRRFTKDPIVWLEYISKYQCDLTYASNFSLDYTIKFCHKNSYRLRNLDFSATKMMVSAEPTSLTVANAFLELLSPLGLKPNALMPIFGMTEATACITVPAISEIIHAIPIDKTNLQLYAHVPIISKEDSRAILAVSNAKPIECLEIRITDEFGKELPEGFLGHFCARGPTIIEEYYNTGVSVLRDGWFDTGDIGFLLDGELYVTSRYKYMFIINSKNFYSGDLEYHLIGENSCTSNAVWIVGYRKNNNDTNDSVICFLSDMHDTKALIKKANTITKSIAKGFSIILEQVIPISEIPKTESGKVQRYKMLENYRNGMYGEAIERIRDTREIIATDYELSEENVCHNVLVIIQEVVEVELEGDDYFSDAGLTSLQFAQIYFQLERTYNGLLSVAELYEFPTARLLSLHIIKNQK